MVFMSSGLNSVKSSCETAGNNICAFSDGPEPSLLVILLSFLNVVETSPPQVVDEPPTAVYSS